MSLDVLRGLALFGVLLVNLLTFFRVSLFQHISTFHSHQDWANRATDVLMAGLLESKAFDLFSFLFGAGVAVQAERAAGRAIGAGRFFVRRFLLLLGIGLFHMLLISNVDILVLYAVCGLLLIPTLPLTPRTLGVLSVCAIALPYVTPISLPFPSFEIVRAHAERATQIYREGTFFEILAFRAQETVKFIAPLLVGVFPKTLGLMLLGMAAWRWGVLRDPWFYRRLLWAVLLIGGIIGGVLTSMRVITDSTGVRFGLPSALFDLGSHMPLALAYAAGLLLWLGDRPPSRLTAPLAAAGQMALTNYLTQSLVLGFIFYGYGLGLIGQLGPAIAALIGMALYLGQLSISRRWLRTWRFGPVEWLWRSLTYRQRQPFLR